jgi:hypothetical protein
MQTFPAGAIQSLTNPVTSSSNNLLDAYNAASNKASFNFKDCGAPSTIGQTGIAQTSTESGKKYFTLSLYPANYVNDPDKLCFRIKAQIPDNISLAFYKILRITASYIEFEISPGNSFLAPVVEFKNNCNSTCLDGVLNASATEYTNAYTYNYDDFRGNPFTSTNTYRTGAKGIWRTRKSLVYNTKRKQTHVATTTTSNFNSYTGKDGTFEKFNFYNWKSPQDPALDADQYQWVWTSIVSKYSPLGWAYESLDPLGNYSTELYARDHSLVLATAANASAGEIGYDGFETYQVSYPTSFGSGEYCGHLPFTGFSGTNLVNKVAPHTGNYSIEMGSPTTLICSTQVYQSINNSTPNSGNTFRAFVNKTYLISAWIRKDGVNFNTSTTVPGIDVTYTVGGTPQTLSLRIKYGTSIDKWYKVEGTFKPTTYPSSVVITLIPGTITGSSNAYFDDIRVQPVNSGMKTYVYDWYTFNLMAEMDNNNYATFYNYSNEGKLVQVKQETEKGIVTISTSASNVKR